MGEAIKKDIENPETDQEDISLVLEEYKLLLSKESNENSIKWMAFHIFAIINGLFITGYLASYNITYLRVSLPLVGFIFSIVWFLNLARTINFHEHWKAQIRAIEDRFKFKTPFVVFSRKSKFGILGRIPSHRIMYVIVFIIILFWVYMMLNNGYSNEIGTNYSNNLNDSAYLIMDSSKYNFYSNHSTFVIVDDGNYSNLLEYLRKNG